MPPLLAFSLSSQRETFLSVNLFRALVVDRRWPLALHKIIKHRMAVNRVLRRELAHALAQLHVPIRFRRVMPGEAIDFKNPAGPPMFQPEPLDRSSGQGFPLRRPSYFFPSASLSTVMSSA